MPHPDELATLLALPPAAREALARCEGPGCLIADYGKGPDVHGQSFQPPPYKLPDHEWWLPASEAAILALVPGCPSLDLSERGTWRAWTDDHATEWLPTARLAALRLLAAVA